MPASVMTPVVDHSTNQQGLVLYSILKMEVSNLMSSPISTEFIDCTSTVLREHNDPQHWSKNTLCFLRSIVGIRYLFLLNGKITGLRCTRDMSNGPCMDNGDMVRVPVSLVITARICFPHKQNCDSSYW